MTISREYAIHSDEEPARLDRQAAVIGIEDVLGKIPVSPGSQILDAGCGSASMARLLARTRPDAEITGLDIREAYLDYARRKAEEEQLGNLKLVHGSLLDLPFPDSNFDVVWVCLVLHWLAEEDLERAVSELSRVVRPGGWVICAEPDGVGTNHYPMPSEMLEQWSKVTQALFEPNMGRRLFPLMHRAGLIDIDVDVRPYFFHAFGEVDAKVMKVIEEALEPATPRIAQILGNSDDAKRLLDGLKAHLKRPDTVSYPLWFISAGRKPS